MPTKKTTSKTVDANLPEKGKETPETKKINTVSVDIQPVADTPSEAVITVPVAAPVAAPVSAGNVIGNGAYYSSIGPAAGPAFTGSTSRPSYQNNYSQGAQNGNGNSPRYQQRQGQGQSQGYTPRGNYSNPAREQNEDAYYNGEVVSITGMLEVLPDYGVVRQKTKAEENLPRDVYISHSQIKRFNLRMGDIVKGFARPPKEGERYLSLLKIEAVEDMPPEVIKKRPIFTELTAIFPNEWLKLETTQDVMSTRLIDIVSPIGKGQRAMIVAPPKAGKTWLLTDIANGITTNHPDVVLLVALIGERPEEVTHFSRSVKGEVFASNFDERAEDQTRVSELCLERAKRLAERGKDVVILMDSLTRLARAYNMVAPPSGRTLTGGFDPAALYPAKHFFGAARNLEEAGSVTIIATALVETGSRMDDVIFEEFKGTGNMELRLDRALAERRVFPTIDIKASGTRHEELLFPKDMLDQIFRFRRMIDLLEDKDATELVIDRLKKAKTNKEFIDNLHKGA